MVLVLPLHQREEEHEWQRALEEPTGYKVAPLGPQMEILIAQRRLAGDGSPADRMFFTCVAIVSALVAAWLAAEWSGVAPVSSLERAFVGTVRGSTFAREPRLAAVLKTVDSGLYTSKSDFELVADAAQVAARQNCQSKKLWDVLSSNFETLVVWLVGSVKIFNGIKALAKSEVTS